MSKEERKGAVSTDAEMAAIIVAGLMQDQAFIERVAQAMATGMLEQKGGGVTLMDRMRRRAVRRADRLVLAELQGAMQTAFRNQLLGYTATGARLELARLHMEGPSRSEGGSRSPIDAIVCAAVDKEVESVVGDRVRRSVRQALGNLGVFVGEAVGRAVHAALNEEGRRAYVGARDGVAAAVAATQEALAAASSSAAPSASKLESAWGAEWEGETAP